MVRAKTKRFSFKIIMHGFLIVFLTCIIILSFIMNVQQNGFNIFIGNTEILATQCSFLENYGVRCPACGLTRGYIYVTHGMFREAWDINRMAIILYIYSIFQLIYSLFYVITKGKYEKEKLYLIPVSLCGLLIINWIIYLI